MAGGPFHIGAGTFRYVASSQLIIDVIRGGGDSFSREHRSAYAS